MKDWHFFSSFLTVSRWTFEIQPIRWVFTCTKEGMCVIHIRWPRGRVYGCPRHRTFDSLKLRTKRVFSLASYASSSSRHYHYYYSSSPLAEREWPVLSLKNHAADRAHVHFAKSPGWKHRDLRVSSIALTPLPTVLFCDTDLYLYTSLYTYMTLLHRQYVHLLSVRTLKYTATQLRVGSCFL